MFKREFCEKAAFVLVKAEGCSPSPSTLEKLYNIAVNVQPSITDSYRPITKQHTPNGYKIVYKNPNARIHRGTSR